MSSITLGRLQKELRSVENMISLYDLGQRLGCTPDELLTFILQQVLPEYKQQYDLVARRLPSMDDGQATKFFTQQIIDVGFLCQHKISDINEAMRGKLNTFGHQIFYNKWLTCRGY